MSWAEDAREAHNAGRDLPAMRYVKGERLIDVKMTFGARMVTYSLDRCEEIPLELLPMIAAVMEQPYLWVWEEMKK